jgi:hypothetical protein
MAAENMVPEGAVENSCVVRVNNKSFLVGSFVWCATIVACVFMVTSNHGGDARGIAAGSNLRGADVDVVSQSTIRALREEIESLKMQQRTLKTSTSSKSSSSSSSKKSKKSVDTINFEETFNPTPVRLHPTTFPTASPVEEESTHTKGGNKDKNKGDKIHKSNHDSSVDSIDFEETFNPTPVRLHPTTFPTAKPVEEKSKDKKDKDEDDDKDVFETRAPTPKGYNADETFNPTPKADTFAPTPDNLAPRTLKKSVFAPGYETYAPTPENFGKTQKPASEKRTLKKSSSSKVDTINYVETFAPTPENYPKGKRAMKSSKVDTINYVETFAPTPENYPKGKRALKSDPSPEEADRLLKNSKVDTIDFEETFSPTPEDYHVAPGKRDLKKNRPLQ